MEYGHASFSRIPCGLERRAMWVLSLISLHFVAIIFLCHTSIDGVPLNGPMKFQRRHIDYIDDDSDDDYDDTSMCQLSNGIVANRNNCNQFYICGDDDRYPPTLGICPPGMWFDPVHTEVDDIVCIYPEVACTNPQLDMFKYCKCHELYPTGIVAANGHNNNTDALLEKSSQCIVDNQFHLYASAIDCERYFICFNGNVKRLQCKSGLHFNAANGHCDHPLTANCHVNYERNILRVNGEK